MVIKIDKAKCCECKKMQSVKITFPMTCKYCGSNDLVIGNNAETITDDDIAYMDKQIEMHYELLRSECKEKCQHKVFACEQWDCLDCTYSNEYL